MRLLLRRTTWLLPACLFALTACNNPSSSENATKKSTASPATQQDASTPTPSGPSASTKQIDPNAPFPALTTIVLMELSTYVPELTKPRDAILAAERDALRIAIEKFRSSRNATAKGKESYAFALPTVSIHFINTTEPIPSISTTAVLNASDWHEKNSGWSWIPRMARDAFAAEPTTGGSVLDRVSVLSPEAAAAIDGLYMLIAGANTYLLAGASEKQSQMDTPSREPVPIAGQEGTVTSSVGFTKRTGSTTIDLSSEANVLLYGLKANSKVSLTTPLCPDADGHLSFTIKYSGNGSVGKGGTVSYDHNVEAKITTTADDDANLIGADIQVTQATQSTDGGKAVYVETSQKARATNTDYRQWQWGDPQLVRESSQVTATDRNRIAGKGLLQATQLAAGAMAGAESQWKSGICIKINATSPGTVKPKATSKIPVSVAHRKEGTAVPAKVTVDLSGGESVSPSVIPKTPGDVTHTAVDKDGAAMTIKLTATSKRGMAEETLKITTKGMVFKLDGGADEFHGTGIVCDFEKPFKIAGDGLTVTFTPSSNSGGTYKYSGKLHGFEAWGKGSYTVKYDGDNPVHLTSKGPGTVKTPMGDMTADGTEEYSVSASQDGCPYDKMLLD